jgi:hypothetical protein
MYFAVFVPSTDTRVTLVGVSPDLDSLVSLVESKVDSPVKDLEPYSVARFNRIKNYAPDTEYFFNDAKFDQMANDPDFDLVHESPRACKYCKSPNFPEFPKIYTWCLDELTHIDSYLLSTKQEVQLLQSAKCGSMNTQRSAMISIFQSETETLDVLQVVHKINEDVIYNAARF